MTPTNESKLNELRSQLAALEPYRLEAEEASGRATQELERAFTHYLNGKISLEVLAATQIKEAALSKISYTIYQRMIDLEERATRLFQCETEANKQALTAMCF